MNYTVSNTCGNPLSSACVDYEITVPTSSNLSSDLCVSIEKTTKDLYDRTESILDETDLSELGNSCLSYITVSGRNIVKNVLLKYEEEICTLKQKVADLESGKSICDMPISGCNFNLGTLVDSCGVQPTTFGELLQILLNQHNI